MTEAKSPIRRTRAPKAKAEPTPPANAVVAAPIEVVADAAPAEVDAVASPVEVRAAAPIEAVAASASVEAIAVPAGIEEAAGISSPDAGPPVSGAPVSPALEAATELPAAPDALFDAPEDFRDLAIRVLDRAQAEVERSKRAIDGAAAAFEATLEIGRAGRREIEAASFGALKDNVEATRAHVARLAVATTVAEAIELNASFFRAGFEATAAQAKALQAIALRRTGEAFGPAGEIVGRLLAASGRD